MARKVKDAVTVVDFVAVIVGSVVLLLSVAMAMTNVAVALSDFRCLACFPLMDLNQAVLHAWERVESNEFAKRGKSAVGFSTVRNSCKGWQRWAEGKEQVPDRLRRSACSVSLDT